ncbi:hypothetical protein IFT82_00285 [Sphingomonas sp. CFBP 8760]|nr:hypothetical protein [Sphingomonas sp. CFBP 8760]
MPVDAGGDRFHRLAVDGDTGDDVIGRHDARDPCGERALERLDMFLQRGVVEHRDPAVTVMSVEPVRIGAIADPVLDHRHHAVARQSLLAALKAGDMGLDQGAGDGGVRSEGAGATRPARFGERVGLGRQCLMDAGGAIFAARDIGETPHQGRIAQRGEAQRLGPLRIAAGPGTGPDDGLEMVSRIRTDRQWNAETGTRRDRL